MPSLLLLAPDVELLELALPLTPGFSLCCLFFIVPSAQAGAARIANAAAVESKAVRIVFTPSW
jgi:hypothetical protein